VKVDAYNGINAYLAGLIDSPVTTVEDIVAFNSRNPGTEGPRPGDTPAFASGQVSITGYSR